MAVIVAEGEIVLTGTVGDSLWGDGFTVPEVVTALAQVGRANDVLVRLSSGGGYAADGAAIHAALVTHKGKVTVRVEGMAASAASLIAMAGTDIIMMPGATMMIHEAATIAWGDADELRKAAAGADVISAAYAAVYAERAGITVDEARALMKAETWMTPEDAVARGFATSVGAPANENEPEAAVPAFAYAAYAKAPATLRALADAKGWSMATAKGVASAPPPAPADPAAVAEACAKAGAPELAAALIREQAPMATVTARLDLAGKVRKAVADARAIVPAAVPPDMEAKLLAEGAALPVAKAVLLDRLLAAQSPPISSHADPLPPDPRAAAAAATAAALDPAAVYAKRAKAAGWPR